ncbi:MAG TPA: hypothetical protein VJ227_01445 [Patescibacteria group bacterium]|nr:hypothetical protein [Patescibacteria group bacterium]
MGKRQLNLLVIVCLLFALLAVIIVARFYLAKPASNGVETPVNQGQNFPDVFAEVEPGPKSTTITAPNGKMSLTVREEKTENGTIQTFSVTEKEGDAKEIYRETVSQGVTISVPYNTFSPDNTYIFLKRSGAGMSYFVLKTDGSLFADGSKTIDFVKLFNEKYPETPAADITGWGGMTLVVINTHNPDGTVDHSFWYDASSNSFIALSTRFN